MEIQRDSYLEQLKIRKDNGMIKIITGIRRCGKSYLLFVLFKKYLLEIGIEQDHIIEIALDGIESEEMTGIHSVGNFLLSGILLGNDFIGNLSAEKAIVVQQIGSNLTPHIGIDGRQIDGFTGKGIEYPFANPFLSVYKSIVGPQTKRKRPSM